MQKVIRGFRGGYRLVKFLQHTRREVNKIKRYQNTKRHDEKASTCLKRWGRQTLSTLNVEVHADFDLPGRPAIYVCNHKSYLDGAVLAAYTGSFFVIKSEALKWPILGKYIQLTRNIAVDRISARSRLQSGLQIKQRIMNGGSVVVFAEGTTYKEAGCREPENGVFKLSAQTGIPIVPVVLEYQNPDAAWVGDESFLPHFIRTHGQQQVVVGLKSGPLLASTESDYLKSETRRWIELNSRQIRAQFDFMPSVRMQMGGLVSPV